MSTNTIKVLLFGDEFLRNLWMSKLDKSENIMNKTVKNFSVFLKDENGDEYKFDIINNNDKHGKVNNEDFDRAILLIYNNIQDSEINEYAKEFNYLYPNKFFDIWAVPYDFTKIIPSTQDSLAILYLWNRTIEGLIKPFETIVYKLYKITTLKYIDAKVTKYEDNDIEKENKNSEKDIIHKPLFVEFEKSMKSLMEFYKNHPEHNSLDHIVNLMNVLTTEIQTECINYFANEIDLSSEDRCRLIDQILLKM